MSPVLHRPSTRLPVAARRALALVALALPLGCGGHHTVPLIIEHDLGVGPDLARALPDLAMPPPDQAEVPPDLSGPPPDLVLAAECPSGVPTFAEVKARVLDDPCANGCHSANLARGMLDLQSGAYAALVNGLTKNSGARGLYPIRVLPFKPESSYLYKKLSLIADTDKVLGDRMPQGGARLGDAELDLVRCWILAGAQDN